MAELGPDVGLWALFVSAFVSSTLAPGGSEAVLAFLVSQGGIDDLSLLLTATLGNTLGALTTWCLGALTSIRYPLDKITDARQLRGFKWIRRWGSIILLLSWLPVVGDALCFAAGWLRLPLVVSLVMIAVGKAARYAAIIYLFS